jgi:hypothetical protein
MSEERPDNQTGENAAAGPAQTMPDFILEAGHPQSQPPASAHPSPIPPPGQPMTFPAPNYGGQEGPAWVGERVWKEAPQIVKSARTVAKFLIFLSILVVLSACLMISDPKTPESAIAGWVVMVFYGGMGITCIWLLFGLKRGYPAAWTVQMVLSIVGLLMFPIVTLISILILVNWFKRETKAWFGLS